MAVTLKSAEAAARLMPNDAESQKLLAAASMDLGKATGASPESTLGFLQSVGASSRVTSLKFLAENVTPGIAGISKFGGSEREADALLAGNTLAGTDVASRESVAKFTEATGKGIVDSWQSWGGYRAWRLFGQSPNDAAANTLAGRAASLEAPTYVRTAGLPGAQNRIEASEENRASAAALREAAAAMREAAKGMVKAAAKEPVKIVKPDVPVRHASPLAGVGR